MIVKRLGDWMSAKVGDELVMMSVQNGRYLGLSDTGARVWELIEAPLSLDDICALLEKEFDVAPDICRAEVEAFLGEMAKHGAIALDPPPAA